MSYSYGNTPTTITPVSGNWAGPPTNETWILNTALTTATHVYYDCDPTLPNHHTPARIAINYASGTTANAQVWETASGISGFSPYLQIDPNLGGAGDSQARYTGPNGTPANMVTFDKFFVDVSGAGPTVTEITVGRAGPFSSGGSSFYTDGTIVSNDTIVASDITLYKDGQSYSNSNVTMHGNDFELTYSGDGVYIIECGGKTNSIFHQDETWFSNITSNSSSRSTNSIAIRTTLATIPQDLKIYYRSWLNTSTEPSDWMELGDPVYFNNTYTPHYTPHFVQYTMASGSIRNIFRFSLNQYQKSDGTNAIGGIFHIHKYDEADPLNNYVHHMDKTVTANGNVPEYKEIGASPTILSDKGLNNNQAFGPNGVTLPAGTWFYDSRYAPNYPNGECYQLKVNDWVFYASDMGDYDDETDDPPDNEHDYPGGYAPRRRRAHSFW